jgi:hypothetical protein
LNPRIAVRALPSGDFGPVDFSQGFQRPIKSARIGNKGASQSCHATARRRPAAGKTATGCNGTGRLRKTRGSRNSAGAGRPGSCGGTQARRAIFGGSLDSRRCETHASTCWAAGAARWAGRTALYFPPVAAVVHGGRARCLPRAPISGAGRPAPTTNRAASPCG